MLNQISIPRRFGQLANFTQSLKKKKRAARRRRRMMLEPLETRALLAVVSLSPSGDQGSTIERDRDTYEFSIVRQEEGSDDFSIEYHDQVKVYYVITGNGITDNDYSFWTNACYSGSDETGDYLYFPAGGTSINMTLQVKNDSENEDDEVLTLSLAGVVDDGAYSGCCSGGCCTCCCGGSSCCGGTPISYSIDGSADEAFFTIADDDGWALQIERSSAANEIIERSGEATFKVTRVDDGGPGGSGDLTYPIRVDMTMSGLAQQYIDYNLSDSGGYLQMYGDRTVIDAGETIAEFTLASINDRLRELDEDVVISIDGGESIGIWVDDSSCCGGSCCGGGCSGGGSSYYLNGGETFNADSTLNSASVTIKDDDDWEIEYEVIDEIAIEPCSWIPGDERTGAVQVNKIVGPSGDSDPTYDIDVVFNLGGSASPANGGFDEDYHLTTSSSGGVPSAVIMVNQGSNPPSAILTLSKDESTAVIYVMPNGDHIFEADETVVLTATKAYPEDTDSENFDIQNNTPNAEITILQPPEFISGTDTQSTTAINQDSYQFYVLGGSSSGGKLIGEIEIGSRYNRSVQYSIHSGNDDGYFAIDTATGEISLAKATDANTPDQFQLVIWCYDNPADSNYPADITLDVSPNLVRDVATVSIDLFEVTVSEIAFNHDTSSHASDGYNLRKDKLTPITIPEYSASDPGRANAALYKRDTSGITILVRYGLSKPIDVTLDLKGISADSGDLGDTDLLSVTFVNGVVQQGSDDAATPYDERAFVLHTLSTGTGSVIRKCQESWNWKATYDTTTADIGTTTHTVYTNWDTPQSPWSTVADSVSNPWITALDFVNDDCGASGKSDTQALAAITTFLHDRYAYQSVARHWTASLFDYTSYMNVTSNVNCNDSAAGLATSATLLGIDVTATKQTGFPPYVYHCFVKFGANGDVYDCTRGYLHIAEDYSTYVNDHNPSGGSSSELSISLE